ncbi:hypothetical protein CCR95_21300 [Thiocystis minor]|uniref:DUF29 domain-containing protein n=1 Tax=Thiocystis minor TaxID=61597 RepID=UPI001911FD97|nr:DUF29 domain-containing protein [Thiocystis minor]MBK5966540.1 hypothetical protein [Thiocystis minor]
MHTYENDLVAWAQEQASLLRARRFDLLDITHLAEEIDDVGKSEQRELANRMAVLLVHLLKWQYQAARRGTSWESTIREQRRALARRLQKTPSLRTCLEDSDWWEDAWLDARTEATRETGIGFDVFPPVCPWTASNILDDRWTPS